MDSQIVENKWFGCKVNNEIYNRTPNSSRHVLKLRDRENDKLIALERMR